MIEAGMRVRVNVPGSIFHGCEATALKPSMLGWFVRIEHGKHKGKTPSFFGDELIPISSTSEYPHYSGAELNAAMKADGYRIVSVSWVGETPRKTIPQLSNEEKRKMLKGDHPFETPPENAEVERMFYLLLAGKYGG